MQNKVYAKVVATQPTTMNLGKMEGPESINEVMLEETMPATGIVDVYVGGLGTTKIYIEGLKLVLDEPSRDKLAAALVKALTLNIGGAK